MNGFNIAEAGHVVNALPPVSISGGKTAQAFSMKGAEHVSILIVFGAKGVANPTSIVLNQCSSAAGANPAAMGFRYYIQSNGGAGAGGSSADVFDSGPNYAPVGGITSFPTSVADCVYSIELDAAELEDLGLPYLQVVIADSGNVTIAAILPILSGQRNQYQQSATVTT